MRRKKIIQFYKCIQFVIVRVKHGKEERGEREKQHSLLYDFVCVCVVLLELPLPLLLLLMELKRENRFI